MDDMEWVDTSTIDALLCLRSRFNEGPVFILGAFRTDVVNETSLPSHPIRPLIETTSRPDLNSLKLRFEGLSQAHIAAVVEAILSSKCKMSDEHTARLYAESEGNPLFLREILYSLLGDDTASYVTKEGETFIFQREIGDLPIPATIEEAVKARLSQIDIGQRAELERAAVIGRNFAYSIIAALTDRPGSALDENLEYLLRLHIIDEVEADDDAVFQFSHGKLRDVTYEQIPAFKRRRMHLQVAEIFEKLSSDFGLGVFAGAIGRHYLAAGKPVEAGPYLLEAARISKGSFALSQAAEQFGLAVSCFDRSTWPDHVNKFDVQLEFSECLKLLGRYEDGVRICESALTTSVRDEQKGSLLNQIGDLNWLLGKRAESLAAYEDCERLARATKDEGLLLEVVADLAEFFDREAERIAGDDKAVAAKLREKSDVYLAEQVGLANRLGKRDALARAIRNDAKRIRRTGDISGALARYREALAYLDERIADHSVLISYAKTLRLAGLLIEAEVVIRRVLEWGIQIGAKRTEGIARQYLGQLAFTRANEASPDALDQLLRALEIFRELRYDRGLREVRLLLGEYHFCMGERTQAEHYLSSVVGEDRGERSLADVVQSVCSQLVAMDEIDRADRLKANYVASC